MNTKKHYLDDGREYRLYKTNDQLAEIFLVEEEIIIEVPILELNCLGKNLKPKSRKEFYILVKSAKTSKSDIKKTLDFLFKTKKIESDNKDDVYDLFLNEDMEKGTIIEKFQKMRDDGLLKFTLINNHFHKKSYKKKKPTKKNFNK